jgi:hypothetical protein
MDALQSGNAVVKRGDIDEATVALRAKYLSRPDTANDLGNVLAFTLTVEQFATIVKGAVAQAMADSAEGSGPAPLLLNRNGIAKALGCSASQIDRLRQRGLPTQRFGDCPRFDLEAVRQWIREQKDESP